MNYYLLFSFLSIVSFAETFVIGNNTTIDGIQYNSSSKFISKTKNIKASFSKIDINLVANFTINTHSNYNNVIIKMDDKNIDNLSIYVQNNKLYIRASKDIVTNLPITITINCNGIINNILSKGISEININNLNENDFTLSVDGDSEIKFKDGNINNLKLNAKGNYKIDFSDVKVKKASIIATDLGEINLNVSNSLDVKLFDMAEVFYVGSPKITQEIKDMSQLERR